MTDIRDDLQQSLGHAYTLERELGGGGMSRTYLAQDTARISSRRAAFARPRAPTP